MKIAFGYKMGSGKDTAVDFLIENYGGTRIAFADPLYHLMEYAQKYCGFPLEKDRKFLQWIGTEWGRSIDDNVWINKTIEKSNETEGDVYCNDVRFINEFRALKDNGWVCIKINRKHRDIDRAGTGNSNHSSETALDVLSDDEWDCVIDNNGTLEEFLKKIENIYIEIMAMDYMDVCDNCGMRGLNSVMECICDLSPEEKELFEQRRAEVQKEFIENPGKEYPFVQF